MTQEETIITDEETPTPVIEEVLVIDDAQWDQLIELTGGAAAQCFQCGVCTAACPWGLVRDETVSIRGLMRNTQIGIKNGSQALWLCTTCAQCEAYCPRGVAITDVFRGLRQAAWEQGQPAAGLPSVLWSVYWNNNPLSQAPSHRSLWAKDLEIPIFDPAKHEVLYYIGCTSSYDRRAQKIARALVKLFNAAGVSFGFLGDEEPCCGESVLNLGHEPYFQEIVEHTSRLFETKGVSKMVTVSPHCYDVFANHYPKINPAFEPVHYTQYLAGLIADGRITFDHPLELNITFQDPCYLSRHNHEERAPRSVLAAIPGIALTEMADNGIHTLCCGGGGGRMFLETEAGDRFSDLRVDQAQATGASVLATACPGCISCLEDSVKAHKIKDLVVMDIAEIGALALDKV
ncbi:MAG: (Fe-S)-binding protein [Anaerolineae bacterium]|nr:(Fe-S)-binding protein [Anaerolineae bacterium]